VIEAVGIVIPARDEEDLLPSCLAAAALAAELTTGADVDVIVVADSCTDRTALVAARSGAIVVEGTMGNVGEARRAGAAEFLRRHERRGPANLWIATTDADTLVPPCWLTRQLRHAARGWDAVAGVVRVADWQGYPEHSQTVYNRLYEAGHPHVHGANLGVNAAAYLAAGGFGRLRTGEDHALVNALSAAGRKVLHTTDVTVQTSARRTPRAPHGFGDHLAELEHRLDPPHAVPGPD
jgi:glycosyltransferase involved in cell wall biosynthesis